MSLLLATKKLPLQKKNIIFWFTNLPSYIFYEQCCKQWNITFENILQWSIALFSAICNSHYSGDRTNWNPTNRGHPVPGSITHLTITDRHRRHTMVFQANLSHNIQIADQRQVQACLQSQRNQKGEGTIVPQDFGENLFHSSGLFKKAGL